MPDLTAPYDIAIIGAGIIGLATAEHLLRAKPDARIVIVEKEPAPGLHQTGRNSGVIHAGIYYAPGSLKAVLCKQGAAQTKQFCAENDVPFETCGKLIVATETSELPALAALAERATTNGLTTRLVDQEELREIEPAIAGRRALLSPETGIVDYGQICRVLARKLQQAGVAILYDQTVTGLRETSDIVRLTTDHTAIEARQVIACAGLQADRIAAMSGLADDFCILPFRGEYYRVAEDANCAVSHLIYPVPDPALPFLGVHLTRMIGGFTTVGPNAMFSLGRETYARNAPQARDLRASLRFAGFWRLMAANAGHALSELRASVSKTAYLRRCQRYAPTLTLKDLLPHPTGIRAQAVQRDGTMIDDFLIRQTARCTHLCNAPSPAATSAFPIAAEITRRVLALHTG